jgi:hypothetical protein
MLGGTRRLAVWTIVAGLTATSCAAAADDPAANADDADGPQAIEAGATADQTVAPARRAVAQRRAAKPRRRELKFRRTVDAAAPLRVGFIGDSVAWSIVPTLGAVAEELNQRRKLPFSAGGGFQGPGFGLTSDIEGHNDIGPTAPPSAYAGWRDSVARMVMVDDPDVVLVLLGIWDTIERMPGGELLKPGMPRWQQWYSALAHDFVKTVTARGANVVWLLMPCVGRADLNVRLAAVNAVLRDTWRVAPGQVGFVELGDVACRNGAPIYQVPGPWGPLTVREADGIHFRPLEAPGLLRPFLVRRFTSLLHDVYPHRDARVAAS